jgi:hypothetical protein
LTDGVPQAQEAEAKFLDARLLSARPAEGDLGGDQLENGGIVGRQVGDLGEVGGDAGAGPGPPVGGLPGQGGGEPADAGRRPVGA